MKRIIEIEQSHTGRYQGRLTDDTGACLATAHGCETPDEAARLLIERARNMAAAPPLPLCAVGQGDQRRGFDSLSQWLEG